jgi:putative FmdB family regulatory protein
MIYEFRCEECGKINTKSLPISSNQIKTTCSFCGAIAKKIISKGTSFILKGDKWASKKGY